MIKAILFVIILSCPLYAQLTKAQMLDTMCYINKHKLISLVNSYKADSVGFFRHINEQDLLVFKFDSLGRVKVGLIVNDQLTADSLITLECNFCSKLIPSKFTDVFIPVYNLEKILAIKGVKILKIYCTYDEVFYRRK